MNTLFSTSGYTPFDILSLDNGSSLHLRELPAFLRVLLTTDGTVTKSIESYFWEPVLVKTRAQQRQILSCAVPYLNKAAGDEVMVRDVSLEGENSAKEYARAHSYVCTEALSANMAADLESGRVGIGELIRECGLETYRELVELGREEFNGAQWITRTYRIVMAHRPFIQITEKFPLALYAEA